MTVAENQIPHASAALSSTLHRVMAIDVLADIDSAAHEARTSKDTGDKRVNAIHDLEEAGVRTYFARGSGLFLGPYASQYQRNNDDLDLNIIGTQDYTAKDAKIATKSLMDTIATSRGYRLGDEPNRPTIIHKPGTAAPVRIEKKHLLNKARWQLDATFDADRLKDILAKAEYYHLSERDKTLLNEALSAGKPVASELALNCIFKYGRSDLKPVDKTGNELDPANAQHFVGVTYNAPLAQLVEKLDCVYVSGRNKLLDVTDLYALSRIINMGETGFSDEQVKLLKDTMFKPHSRFRNENFWNGVHILSPKMISSVTRHGFRDIRGDDPQFSYLDNPEKALEMLKVAYDKNMIDHMPSKEEITPMLALVKTLRDQVIRELFEPAKSQQTQASAAR